MSSLFELKRTYSVGYELLFNSCKDAVSQCGFSVTEQSEAAGKIRATVSISLWSFGEIVEIDIRRDGTVDARSMGRFLLFPLLPVDYFKNKSNVQNFFEALDRTLVVPPSPQTTQGPDPDNQVLLHGDRVLTERTEVIATEELPLDNRFGSRELLVEHELSKTSENSFSFDVIRNSQGRLEAQLLTMLKAEVSRAVSKKAGQAMGSSVTRRFKMTFSVQPGDSVIYRIIWSRKVLNGEYDAIVAGRGVCVAYSAAFDLQYEVTSGRSR